MVKTIQLKKHKLNELLYLFAFMVVVIVKILGTSQFRDYKEWNTVYLVGICLGCLIAVLSFVGAKLSLRYMFVGILFFLIMIMTSKMSGQLTELLTISLFMYLAVNADERDIFYVYVFSATITVLLILLLYSSGMLVSEVTVQSGNIRQYMGFTYTTFLPNYFYHIVLAYVCLKKKSITILETLFILLLNGMIYNWTYTKAVFFEIIMLIIVLWIVRFFPIICKKKIFSFSTYFSMPILSVLVLYLTYNYKKYTAINIIMSDRLRLGYIAIKKYGIHLFGTEIIWRTSFTNQLNYLFVDSSYLNILLNYGIVLLAVLLVGFFLVGINLRQRKQYLACISLVFLAIHSFSDPQLFDIKYNPFLLLIGSSVIYIFSKDNRSGRAAPV